MKKLFLALPFLLASCHSERVAFQFQRVAPTVGAASTYQPPVAPEEAKATSPSVPAEKAAGRPALRAASHREVQQPATAAYRAARAATATLPSAQKPVAKLTQVQLEQAGYLPFKQLRRQRATAGPARTAENGLGGIALFFIGVALAVLAGLGALVSVIFGTGFFTGLGFAAAGLVVLFLLYSLFSGGKKKKA